MSTDWAKLNRTNIVNANFHYSFTITSPRSSFTLKVYIHNQIYQSPVQEKTPVALLAVLGYYFNKYFIVVLQCYCQGKRDGMPVPVATINNIEYGKIDIGWFIQWTKPDVR